MQTTLEFERLGGQTKAVKDVMLDSQWRTLPELAEEIHVRLKVRASEAGVSARLRDLRKPRFGSHTVLRRKRIGNLYEYKLILNQESQRG